ncbi:peptidase family M1-domain-containing protein [Crucibulum laeve]|uniref:Aminopeptidase n=1 Tax=Crucibulum laeve TaxID=68775 RepID=A0A5C3ME22_9AGAR|nr:peptidase family M1-domain-containing protein [Crucibulum laeve]
MSTTATSQQPDQYRLPIDVKPTHYDVTIKTDLESLTFEGFVKTSLDVKKETSKIVLNTSDLELGKVSVYSDALKSEQAPISDSFDKSQERIAYELSNTLPAGSKAEIKIRFSGKLTGSMMGYYKSSWEHEGKTKYYALTQFEPTAARRAFPCWDEPLLKATFGITLISRADTVNLSNMPATSEDVLSSGVQVSEDIKDIVSTLENEKEKWKITRFETTPPMSSYIVAFANGNFEYLERSVVSPLTQFALDVKADVLPLYEKVFDVEYPLPKLDTLVASDFDAGAMENWGLITGRTSAFLLDPENADLSAKKQIATTQSHEVAHMWFGNITTMEWWNYLYLNEVFPEWKVDSEFIADHLNRALNLDAKLSSHPIEVECPDANHINQIFDSLSYSKAASVLRMLSNYVGEDLFLKGVSIYLKKKLYANSVTNDLWEGISEATKVDVTRLMDNWISKIGFPVLTVTEDANGIHVRQDRFLETGHAEPKDNETIWNIPLSILSADKNGKLAIDKSAILEQREKSFPIDTNKPFKLNASTIGVYRVLYTPERLTKIAKEAAKEDSAFSLNDRIGLVYDAMALSKAGLAKLSSALTLVDILRNEKEHLVWVGIAESVSNLVTIWWEHPQIVEQLNAFRRALFVPLVEKLGYEYSASDSPDITELRTIAISQSAAARDLAVVKELKSRFEHYMKTGDYSKIPADLQRVIFVVAARHGGRAEYDAVIKIHDKPKTPTARIAAIQAMGATEDPQLIQETFKFITTKSKDQDIMYFFRGLSNNFKARRLLAKFFRDEYDVLYKRFEGNFALQYLVSISMDGLASEKDYKEIEAFFKDKDTSKYNQSLAQTLDTIRAKYEYINRSTEDLGQWLVQWEKSRKQ